MQEFLLKPEIYFNKNSVDYLRTVKGNTGLIFADKVMEELGFVDYVKDILEANEIRVNIFTDILPDPDIEMIVNGMRQMEQDFPDVVIALGGGSVIDTTKGVLYSYWKMSEKEDKPFEKPKFIAIPSTSGTGSEVTAFTIIKMDDGKLALVDNWMIPDVAIIDPMFVKSVPPSITADTGIDVLVHALEAYVSTDASDFTDGISEKVIKMVFEYLPRAYENGDDEEAREKMHNASCMAGIAFTNASLGINHSLAHALGGVFKIPHGRANALLVNNVIEYNSNLMGSANSEAAKKYANLAKELGLPSRTPREGTISLINEIDRLKKNLNIPKSIKEMDIGIDEFEDRIDLLTEQALADNCTPTNPIQPNKKDLENIYRKTFTG